MSKRKPTSIEIWVRLAYSSDLEFVQQDAYIPTDVVRQKIDLHEVFVARRNGILVGYARIEYLWSLAPYLALIHVLPFYRRQGVGKAILRFIEEFLYTKDHMILYSSSQADDPEPQAWHRHAGFKEGGIITGINDEGIGEVFFRKSLDNIV